jgi:hypothetical protein
MLLNTLTKITVDDLLPLYEEAGKLELAIFLCWEKWNGSGNTLYGACQSLSEKALCTCSEWMGNNLSVFIETAITYSQLEEKFGGPRKVYSRYDDMDLFFYSNGKKDFLKVIPELHGKDTLYGFTFINLHPSILPPGTKPAAPLPTESYQKKTWLKWLSRFAKQKFGVLE